MGVFLVVRDYSSSPPTREVAQSEPGGAGGRSSLILGPFVVDRGMGGLLFI